MNPSDSLYKYCDDTTKLAKNLKNATIFRYRQCISAKNREFKKLTDTQKEVISEFLLAGIVINDKKYVPSYKNMFNCFSANKNPDYFSSLARQSSQQIMKEVSRDFKSFFKSIKDYKKHPGKYSGKPKLPKYCQCDRIEYTITNQDAVIYGNDLKLPNTKIRLYLGENHNIEDLREVRIVPYYGSYRIILTYKESEVSHKLNGNRFVGLDLGVDNFVTISNNFGDSPKLIKGNIIKSKNQLANKRIAYLKSLLPEYQKTTKQIQRIWQKRSNVFDDFYNKTVTYIFKYCIDNKVGTVAIGKNNHWKRSINIGKTNNQNFCYISHAVFIKKLKSKLESAGIFVVLQEESYTSKSSFLDNDDIPIYQEGAKHKFSGKRIKRGLYKSEKGILINADVNGASNIIRKHKQDAFDGISLTYLLNPEVVRFEYINSIKK